MKLKLFGISELGRNFCLYIIVISFYLLINNDISYSSQPGSPPLSTLAEQALSSGDNELAINLYSRWLEADPSDYVSWYNYACALSLMERKLDALRALDGAVTAGWRNSDWLNRDPDLEFIRHEEDFQKIINRIEDKNRLEENTNLPRGKVNFIIQNRLAPYQLVIPENYGEEEKKMPLIVMLHARRGDYPDMIELAERMALPGVILVMPRAPYPIGGGRDGFEYWPRDNELTGDSVVTREAQKYVCDWIKRTIEDAENQVKIDHNNIILVGYSQGGAAAYISTMETDCDFKGCAVLSGYVPDNYCHDHYFENLARKKLKFFVGHGSRDLVIEQVKADYFVEKSREYNLDTEYKVYPTSHDIPDEMVVDLADWISDLIKQP